MLEKFFAKSPNFVQELMVTFYNVKAYRKRYGGKYQEFLQIARENRNLSKAQLEAIQRKRYSEFIGKAISGSKFYAGNFAAIADASNLDNIRQLPILNKEDLRSRILDVYTISKEQGNVAKTGGTTGKSLEVLYKPENTQERFAMLDEFRSRAGYELGKKTAWFSGKSLLTKSDIRNNRFWKTDHWYKVRYYSTFHIHEKFLGHYVRNLIAFQPEFMVGFPSTMTEIARYGKNHGIEFPAGIVKAIFPTAETVTPLVRETLERYFKTKVYDQYASSEGAPFIFECAKGKLHIELQSGVFEVLDENDDPARNGRLVVTSFTTEGTPLIRYDIGDSLELSDETCDCGNHNPLAKAIHGRIDDYVYSPEIGKINLGNVSNTLKDTKGIVRFQVLQNSLETIIVKIVVDQNVYTEAVEAKFLQNWRDRIGHDMTLLLEIVDEIPVEKSGKYRIVKNNIRHLLENPN
ncbi:phenylacetate--CoA ligase family protein [Flavobacterium sp. D33]|nr:phenylacetate--CoA ligase family protein [Flavobacterium selenitireducens]